MATDLPPLPPRWRSYLPAWIRAIIWVEEASSFDAFLSYSWSADSKVAPLIQSVLQQFLCPWYKPRARRVFRDLSSLPASSSLTESLKQHLDRSKHLIVLACPQAATSEGMEFEASHWLSRPREGQVLVVITSGSYDGWTAIRDTALPPSLREYLLEPPLWVDISARRGAMTAIPPQADIYHQLTEDLAQVILTFYPDMDWGLLRGQEGVQRRRALTLIGAVIAALTGLLGIAGWQWQKAVEQKRVADQQRDLADKQRNEAVRQASIADARRLASEAEQMLATNQVGSFAQAVRAWSSWQTTESRLAVALTFPELAFNFSGHGISVAGIQFKLTSIAYSPDGQHVVISSEDGTARVWNSATAELTMTLECNEKRWFSVARNGMTSIFDRPVPVHRASYSSDGKNIITYSGDGTKRVWDAMSGHLLSKTRGAPPQGDRYEAALPVLSPDGQRAVAIKANQALISRVANGAVLAILQGHREDLTEASFSPDGRWVLTASNDATARVWNASTGKLIAILQGNAGRVPQIRREYAGESHKPDAVTHATFSPDGLGVITARADGTVQIWALAIGQAVGTLERFEAATNGLALSPDGSRIIGYRSKKVLLWNSVDLRQELTLQHPENVENVCFSPDGHWLLTSAEQLRLWNSQTGTLRAVLPASRGSTRARFSHDGRQIITFGAGNDAAVRDSKDGKIRVSLVHQVPINDATFSPDDRLIATSGRDGVARVWNAATGKIRLNLKDETDDNVTEFGVYAATFSPDGKRLAVAGEWN